MDDLLMEVKAEYPEAYERLKPYEEETAYPTRWVRWQRERSDGRARSVEASENGDDRRREWVLPEIAVHLRGQKRAAQRRADQSPSCAAMAVAMY